MSRLDVLKKNMLDMSPDELREHVKDIRRSRKIQKERPASIKKRKVQEGKQKDSMIKALGKLSKAELDALLGGIQDDNDGSADTTQVDQGEGSGEGG